MKKTVTTKEGYILWSSVKIKFCNKKVIFRTKIFKIFPTRGKFKSYFQNLIESNSNNSSPYSLSVLPIGSPDHYNILLESHVKRKNIKTEINRTS